MRSLLKNFGFFYTLFKEFKAAGDKTIQTRFLQQAR